MESYLSSDLYDLASPDGSIEKFLKETPEEKEAIVNIQNISPSFVGFKIDKECIQFNIKSTLAQLGINGTGLEYELDSQTHFAKVKVSLVALSSLGKQMLTLLQEGAFIGKLFVADPRRRVRDPDYLFRMFGRSDREGRPLLSLGGLQGSKDLILEKADGHMVAFISLKEGSLQYEPSIEGFLPTLAKALKYPHLKTRQLLPLHQRWQAGAEKRVAKNAPLLAHSLPLHIRTVFGHVIQELLPKGLYHTTANVLEPDTKASGDIYEFFGESTHALRDVPLEFYTLEPHREHVFFADRDQLQNALDDQEVVFKAFDSAPHASELRSAIFLIKAKQLLSLATSDWITREVHTSEFPGLLYPERQSLMVQQYVKQQPCYPFLKAIETGVIVSQGVLFSRFLPSPLMKKMLLGDLVQSSLKRIYFQFPSQAHENYFSHEDRSMLLDLAKFAIPVFWVDKTSGKILKFVPKQDKDIGMFVPLNLVDDFLKATFFGVYGSNLMEGNFEEQLMKLLEGIKNLRESMNHPLLHKDLPIALVTGGGPGVMEVGNRVAKEAKILSCANIVDFRGGSEVTNEQSQNAFIDAKMTYRLDRLLERQAEFHLDFPIFLPGGFGTDFEFSLEAVRRKVELSVPTPVLLFGSPNYWQEKISSRFQCNLANGTISGSEWVSNCFYCIQTASQGLKIYQHYFTNTLSIGKGGPIYKEGFAIVQ